MVERAEEIIDAKMTPDLLASGMIFALIMGVVGGLPPAIRAARRPVAAALRGL